MRESRPMAMNSQGKQFFFPTQSPRRGELPDCFSVLSVRGCFPRRVFYTGLALSLPRSALTLSCPHTALRPQRPAHLAWQWPHHRPLAMLLVSITEFLILWNITPPTPQTVFCIFTQLCFFLLPFYKQNTWKYVFAAQNSSPLYLLL